MYLYSNLVSNCMIYYLCIMAKSEKKKAKPKKKRANGYNEKLAVNGSFLDIVKAAAGHANDHSKKKK